jgi:ubiquinone/menaquinone biosynthesis C-methylase UbiE
MPIAASNVRSRWNQPAKYERWYVSSLGRVYAESVARVLRPWLCESAGSLVLDIGCGPGLAMEQLLSSESEIIGLDCSLEMAQRASKRSQQTSRPHHFVVGTVERIPFPDATFDFALCINCLEFVENREAAFDEISRVLRPNGIAILGMLNRHSIWEWTRCLRRPFIRRAYYDGRFFSERDVRASCEQAGLNVAEIKTAVHFPPIPPGPLRSVYDAVDRWAWRRASSSGGVILCRASR